MIRNLRLPSSLQQGQINKFLAVHSSHVQKNLWGLREKCIPTVIRDADGGLRAYPRGHLVSPTLFLNGGTSGTTSRPKSNLSRTKDADFRGRGKAFILYFPERLPAILLEGLPAVFLAGLPALDVAYCSNKSQTKTPFN
jgi:hypothetical protein